MKAIYSYLMAYPKSFLGLLLVITVALAFSAMKIQLESAQEGLMIKDDPDRLFFDQVREIFGNDEVLVLALVGKETIFHSETLEKIQSISDELADMDGVERVVSLSTVYNIIGTEEEIEIKPLMEGIPRANSTMEALKASVFKNDLFLNTIVSEDVKAAAINVFLEKRPGEEAYRNQIIARIQEIALREQGPESIYVAGSPYSLVVMDKRQRDDLSTLSPLTGLVIALILFLSFGSIRGVLIPLVTVGIAIVWSFGVMSLLGKPLSAICTGIPSMIMAIGSAYTIHVLSHYYDTVLKGNAKKQDLIQSFTTVSLPVSVTAITTLAGFVAITINRIPAIQDFGMFGIFGILSAWLLSLSLAPALLAVLKVKPPGRWGLERRESTREGFRRLAAFNIRNRRSIITVSLIVFCLGLLGIRYLDVDTEYMRALKKHDPLMLELKEIEHHFSGTVVWNIVVNGEGPDSLMDPAAVQAIDRFQATLKRNKWVDKSSSFVDHLKVIYRAMKGDPEKHYGVPSTREEISQCLLFYSFSDPEILDPYLNHDFSKANIQVRTGNMGSKEMKTWIQEIEQQAQQMFPNHLDAKVAGSGLLALKTGDQVAFGQATSVSLALLVIFVIVWMMFLSLKVALISLVPNMIPIGILFGFMGWMGIPLDTATSLIAALALGIAVDDTIHYLTCFHWELKNTYSESEAMTRALVVTGKPMTYTTFTLCLGFLVLCLSSIVPIMYFGILMALTIATCLLADIFFLPSMLMTTKIITIWDLFLLKIGEDPHKTIPLFEGMRTAHAKILVLMGMLKKYKKADILFRKEGQGQEMYVVLSGQIEIYDMVDGKEQTLAIHSRGDIFGEMGLIRGEVRSASARAREDAEVLEVNADTLIKIQRKYPRISSRLFLNLGKILSKRLQHRTDKYLESLS